MIYDFVPYSLFGDYASCADIAVGVIALALADFHAADARMDELERSGLVVGADHDADMTHVLAAAAAREEHEVALAEVLAVDLHAVGILDSARGTDRISELLVDVACEARAVEGVGTLHAVTVGFADVLVGLRQEVVDHRLALGTEARHDIALALGDVVADHVVDDAAVHFRRLHVGEHLLMRALVCALRVVVT